MPALGPLRQGQSSRRSEKADTGTGIVAALRRHRLPPTPDMRKTHAHSRPRAGRPESRPSGAPATPRAVTTASGYEALESRTLFAAGLWEHVYAGPVFGQPPGGGVVVGESPAPQPAPQPGPQPPPAPEPPPPPAVPQPAVTTVSPVSGAAGVLADAFVSAEVYVPNGGIDPATLTAE